MDHFHAGEVAVQDRGGVRAEALANLAGIGDTIPQVARAFLADQRMLVLGAADADGRLWASVLTGPRGFASAPDERTLLIAARPAPADPLAAVLAAGSHPAGVLAMEPQTRRRMRLNGRVSPAPDGALVLEADEVYSNCPKYIAHRELEADADPDPPAATASDTGDALTATQAAQLRATDTFFIATRAPGGNADASHRGGAPGFVQVLDERHLVFPDYRGNAMFNTLGNLELDPHAGLLVMDWATGATLQLSGTAAIDWDPGRTARFPRAERLVTFTVERVVERAAVTSLRWQLIARSKVTPPAPAAG